MKVMFLTGSCWMRDKEGHLLPFVRSQGFIDIFTMFGDQLVYPPIYWYEGNYMFPYLEKIIEKEHVDLIVGYSAGGHPGFHLCNKYKIKGIHFNPAIAYTSEAPTLQILPNEYKANPMFGEQVMVIGGEDRKYKGGVDGHLVLRMLEEKGFESAGGEILIVPGLAHDVPHPIFKMVFEHFRQQWWGGDNIAIPDEPNQQIAESYA